jgi:hypothetical protein
VLRGEVLEVGSIKNSLRGFVRLVSTFLIVRTFEAAVMIASFAVVAGILQSPEGAAGHSSTASLLSTGLEGLKYYYIAFGYLIVSATVFLLCWLFGLLSSTLRLASVNFSCFLLHSIAIIFALGGHLAPAIWGCWGIAVLYNALFPLRLSGVIRDSG